MLFSATLTTKIDALAKIALKHDPVYVGVDEEQTSATVEGLEQGKQTLN